MNNRYDCNIILDLLPLSIEQMVSKETEQVINRHLEECEACQKVYREMTCEIDVTAEKKKRKKAKKHNYKKKSRIRLLIGGYLLLLLLIVAFCMIDICFF